MSEYYPLTKNGFLLVAAIVGAVYWHPAVARECILPTEFGINHRIYIDAKDDKWVDAKISLPMEHHDNPDYLRLQSYGTCKSGHKKGIIEQIIDTTKYVAQYVTGWGKHIWQEITSIYSPSSSSSEEKEMKEVQDVWSPPACKLDDCFVNKDINACLVRGSVVSNSSPRPCVLENGIGLIGKIVLENAQTHEETSTSVFFAHMNESTEEGVPYFSFVPKQGSDPSHPPQSEGLKGKLYLRLLDNHPGGDGGYNVRISSDLKKRGYNFLQEAFAAFEKSIMFSANAVEQPRIASWSIHAIFTAVVVLYIAISGAMFMIGLMPHKKEVMVSWLLKLCFICSLTHPEVFKLCINLAEEVFIHGSKGLADSIMHASIKEIIKIIREIPHENLHLSMVEVYDSVIYYYFSPGLHLKVWSLVFSKYITYIPLIYAAIWIFLMACVRSAILYIISISMLVLLLAMAPIMISMALFKASKKIFDAWIRSVVNCSLLNIFTAATMGLFAVMIMQYTEIPFQYAICHESLSKSSYVNSIIDIKVWKPHHMPQLDRNMAIDWFAYLLVICIFQKIMDVIPHMVETIAPSLYSPLISMTHILGNVEQRAGTVASFPTGVVISTGAPYAYGRLRDRL